MLPTVVSLILGAAWLYWDWHRFLSTPLIPYQQKFDYRFKPGSHLSTLIHDLQRNGFPTNPFYFRLLAYTQHQSRQLQAGHYLFNGGTTPKELLTQIIAGRVVQYHFTIVEGWRFQDIVSNLEKAPGLKHTISQLNNAQIMQAVGAKDTLVPEGRFFPETYQYIDDVSDVVLLRRAYQLMHERLDTLWQVRTLDLPYQSPYEALIVASLIEKETAISAERPLVAAVIVNRLRKNMLLQIDPTVIYGLAKPKGEALHASDLKQKTPYNTYLHQGLPPTPIAMPSLTALYAALHPAEVSYLYFVAKGDGTHQFSDTLVEQQQAIVKYLTGDKKPANRQAS